MQMFHIIIYTPTTLWFILKKSRKNILKLHDNERSF